MPDAWGFSGFPSRPTSPFPVPPNRRADFRKCRNLKVCGISFDGGYQEYMVALVAIRKSLADVEAAPLLCAGITTDNASRHGGALPGGLGHLGIQFANKFGHRAAGVGRGSESD